MRGVSRRQCLGKFFDIGLTALGIEALLACESEVQKPKVASVYFKHAVADPKLRQTFIDQRKHIWERPYITGMTYVHKQPEDKPMSAAAITAKHGEMGMQKAHCVNVFPAARASRNMMSAVIGVEFARPRTPSVPKSFMPLTFSLLSFCRFWF